jgi:3-dehydroquinate synthase
LPDREWANGFAEVIKHACIKDSSMFRKLEKNSISFYQNNIDGLNKLIRRNVLLKSIIVQKDEFEKGDRRLLNFGHTVGHAIENLTQIPHGHAVSVGMVTASRLSEKITGFTETAKVSGLLKKYDLPVFYEYDRQKVFDVLKMDKKRSGNEIHFVLLNKIGVARVVKIKLAKLEKYLYE